MIESSEATEYLTAAMKGYQVTAEDTMSIIDKMTAIDLKAAASTGDLANALSRTANSARLAGVSMDDVLSYIAVIKETTQKSAESIGTSLQTIFARFGTIKAGKFISEDGDNLNDVQKVLNKFNIELYNSEGQMRDVSGIFTELAGKWKDLTDVERNALATAIAGTRQRENFLALMENFSKATKLASVAAEADGTAMDKFQNYLEGIEAATEKLTAAWEGLVNELISSGFIKFFIDAGRVILELVTNPISAFILKATALFGILKVGTNVFTAVKASMKAQEGVMFALQAKVGQVGYGFKFLVSSEQEAVYKTKLLGAGFDEAGAKAQIAAAKTAALNIILAGLSLAIGIGITAYQKAQQAHEEYIDSVNEEISKISEEQQSLEDLIKEYEELGKKGINTEDSRAEARDIQKQITELVGKQSGNLDLVNGKLDDQLDKLKKISAAQARENEDQLKGKMDVLQDEATDKIKESLIPTFVLPSTQKYYNTILDKYGLLSEESQKRIRNSKGEIVAGNLQKDDIVGSIEEVQEALREEEKELEKNIGKTEKGTEEYNNYKNQLELVKGLIKDTSKSYQDYNNALQAYAKNQLLLERAEGDLRDIVIDSADSFEEAKDRINKSDKYSKEVQEAMIKELENLYPQYALSVEDAAKSNEVFVDTVENLKKELDDLKSTFSDLQSIIEDYNTNGSLTLENFEKLMELEPEYLKYLFDENGRLVDNTKALKKVMQAKADEMAMSSALAFVKQFEGKTDEEVIKLLSTKTDVLYENANAQLKLLKVNIASLDVENKLKNEIWNRAKAILQMANNINFETSATKANTAAKDAAQKTVDDYNKVLSYVTDTIQKRIDALEEEKQLEEDQLALWDKALSYINKFISAKIKALEDEKKALQDKNDEVSREIELEELRNNLQKAKQRTMRVYYEDKGWVWETNPEDVKNAQKALNDFDVEGLVDALDKLIESWQEYLDSWSSIAETYEEEADEKAFNDSQNFVTEQDLRNKDLESLEKFKNAYLQKEKKIKDTSEGTISEQIENLKKLKDQWSKIPSDYEYEQNRLIAEQKLGANAEALIFDDRLTTVKNFVKNYNEAMSKLETAKATSGTTSGTNFGGGGSVWGTDLGGLDDVDFAYIEDSHPAPETYIETTGQYVKNPKFTSHITRTGASNREFVYDANSGLWFLRSSLKLSGGADYSGSGNIFGWSRPFAKGTKDAPAGLANVSEHGNELMIRNAPNGKYTVLQDGDGVLTHNLTERIYDMAMNPTGFVAKALSSLKMPILNKDGESTTISIGNITMPSTVNNAENFVKQLKIIAANR